MITWLSNATKRRLIRELRDILYEHPKYRSDVDNVQNKYAFTERPARGIIVDGTSAERVILSADNYMGRLSSFAMLTGYGNGPNTTVEWVRENFPLLESIDPKRSVFPSPAGVYLFKVVELPDDARSRPGYVTINPVYTVYAEQVIVFNSFDTIEAQLQHHNIYPNSVRLWLDNRTALIPDVDFTVDLEFGTITFLKEAPDGGVVTADYRYYGTETSPLPFYREQFDVKMIPGVVIAFGDRCQLNDTFAVVVTEERTEVADVYGGKFVMNFDLLAFSKDSEDREKFSDYIIMKMLERQNLLGFQGLELVDISPGGENEDVFNPETDEFYYDSTINLSIRVEWTINSPLPTVVWRAEMGSKQQEEITGHLDGTYTDNEVRPDDKGNLLFNVGSPLQYENMK